MSNPPNILKDQEFHVTVLDQRITTAVPTLAPGARLEMTVRLTPSCVFTYNMYLSHERETSWSSSFKELKSMQTIRNPFSSSCD